VHPVHLGAASPLAPTDSAVSRHYLRLQVDDRPGVLASIAAVLGEAGISIASMIQKEADAADGSAEIVITTHPAPEGAMRAARVRLAALSCTRQVAGYLRIEA
jgi:homoserine dehydrogenase